MAHTISLVIVCPAEHVAAASECAVRLGHTDQEFGIALLPASADPTDDTMISHYGLCTWASPETVYAWTQAEHVPGLTDAEVVWLRSVLTISPSTEMSGREHFEAVLQAHTPPLQIWTPEFDGNV